MGNKGFPIDFDVVDIVVVEDIFDDSNPIARNSDFSESLEDEVMSNAGEGRLKVKEEHRSCVILEIVGA